MGPPVSGTVATGEINRPIAETEKLELVEKLHSCNWGIDGEVPQDLTVDGLRLDYERGWGPVPASIYLSGFDSEI